MARPYVTKGPKQFATIDGGASGTATKEQAIGKLKAYKELCYMYSMIVYYLGLDAPSLQPFGEEQKEKSKIQNTKSKIRNAFNEEFY